MLSVFIIMLLGIGAGYLLRDRYCARKVVGKLILLFIFLLLFFLGISVGSNEQVIRNFPVLGLQALLITSGALAGSILLSWFVYIRFFKK